jgi:ubiquitin-protein ligase
MTKIYHPNISMNDGTICVSSTSTDWENNKSIINAIYSIYDLLKMPSNNNLMINKFYKTK